MSKSQYQRILRYYGSYLKNSKLQLYISTLGLSYIKWALDLTLLLFLLSDENVDMVWGFSRNVSFEKFVLGFERRLESQKLVPDKTKHRTSTNAIKWIRGEKGDTNSRFKWLLWERWCEKSVKSVDSSYVTWKKEKKNWKRNEKDMETDLRFAIPASFGAV